MAYNASDYAGDYAGDYADDYGSSSYDYKPAFGVGNEAPPVYNQQQPTPVTYPWNATGARVGEGRGRGAAIQQAPQAPSYDYNYGYGNTNARVGEGRGRGVAIEQAPQAPSYDYNYGYGNTNARVGEGRGRGAAIQQAPQAPSYDYNYGYGNTSAAGYEDYSAGYDYGYGGTWSGDNAGSNGSTTYMYQDGSQVNSGMEFGRSEAGDGGRGRGFISGRGVGRGNFPMGGGNGIGRGAMGDMERGTDGGMGRGAQGSMWRGPQGGVGRGAQGGVGRGAQRGMGRGAQGSDDRGRARGPEGQGQMWAEKRGGGGVRGARGSSFGNRGAISSNRGSRGGAFGRGRGRGDRGGKVSEPITRTDIGVGLTSLHDVIKSASCRKIIGNQEPISPNSPMNLFIERWKAFALGFTDCGNAVSNIECSLKASKLSQLQLNFECKFLAKCSIYSIFTGVLSVNKLLNNAVTESTFLARGMGLSKKSAKMDCYEKAYKLLFNSSIQEIMNQEDCGEEFLTQEVTILYKDNPKGFMDLLKKSNALADIEAAPPSATTGKGRGSGGSKRTSNVRPGGTDPKRGRFADHLTDILENKHLSLAPQKKVGILMHPNDSLYDKLAKLKELLKEEGITKLHIVPKIDQIAHKTAIHIKNVYRFQDVPILGFESRMPVYCEIYFDDIFMADGAADFKRNTAMQLAYTNLSNRLYSQPLEAIVNTARLWEPYMVSEPDICNVVTKWQGEDNNSLLTSNLANMKQMMQSMPDVNLPIDCMVLTEHESDKDIQNVFKALELSATRNLMLLECEIVRNPDMKFTCSLSLQGRLLSSRTHFTKNGAKRSCSEAVMNEMKKKHDYIFVTSKFIGHTITREELELLGAKKKALGEPPGKIFHKRSENKDEAKLNSNDAKKKLDEDKRRNEDIENLPENVRVKPLLPWMAAAMYQIIDEYYTKISLEDLMVNVNNMPKSQRDMVTSCASKMGLRVITKLKNTHDSSLLRRTVTAQDMSKILQLNGGESGRYKLVSCKTPLSKDDLEKFKEECLEHHRKLVEARNNDDPDAEPPVEKKTLDPSHLVKGDAVKSTSAKPDQAVKPTPKTVPPLFSTMRPLIPPMMRRQGPRPLMGPRYPFDGPPRMARPRFFPF